MAIVGLIRVYKWLELGILLIFTPILKTKITKKLASVGLIVHCSDDPEELPQRSELSSNFQNGNSSKQHKPPVYMKVNSDKFFARLANLGMLAIGETYMEGLWECDDLVEVTNRIIESNIVTVYYHPWNTFLQWLELHAFDLNSRKRAFQVGKVHYDLGNDLFETMLGPSMQYTCAYWKDVDNLNDAQLQKMDLLAKKLDLKPGMRVLDFGCGWGTLCKFLAEKYKVECVGVTIGEQGAEYGRQICAGLPVEFRVHDYRETNEKFDRIVCVEMVEHIGYPYYREFFQVANRCLKDDGIFVLQVIGMSDYALPCSDPWSNKYLFPNSNLPTPENITKAVKGLFVIEDWHNFGMDFARTFECWRHNFIQGWPELQPKFGKGSFYRMWNFFLAGAQALFETRKLQLWQIAFSKNGLKQEYRAAR